jgi:hypothetical protein
MALYVLTRYNTGVLPTIDEALEALETKLETVDDAKTVILADVELTGRDRSQAIGWALYET